MAQREGRVYLLEHCRWVHRQMPTQGAGLQGQSDDAEQVDVGIVDSELHKHSSGQAVQPGVVKEILENSAGRRAFRSICSLSGSLSPQPWGGGQGFLLKLLPLPLFSSLGHHQGVVPVSIPWCNVLAPVFPKCYSRGSQSGVPRLAALALASFGDLLEMQILSPHRDLGNQKREGWGLMICALMSPLGDCDAL